MKNTGVVRRIDDLGRIVIPKEIRKTLRIKDGESLEIFLESENIILKKHSPFSNLEEFYKNYVDSIYEVIKENIIITDRHLVIAIAGEKKKEYFEQSISEELGYLIDNREHVFIEEFNNFPFINSTLEKASYSISPIIVNGDSIGSVIIMSTKNKITDFENKAVLIASKFLGKYVEE